MSIETIMSAKNLNGYYPETYKKISCDPLYTLGYTKGCKFPGNKVIFNYFLIKKTIFRFMNL